MIGRIGGAEIDGPGNDGPSRLAGVDTDGPQLKQ